MTTTMFLEDSFDSAHFLPNVYPGHKCAKMHGHTYRIRIEVVGEVGTESDWIMDYADLKVKWESLKRQLDHRIINEIPGLENSTGEYARGAATVNAIESVWAVMKRGVHGIYHHVSPKHLDRYVQEFAWRLNEGNVAVHTLKRLESFIGAVVGKRLTYERLTA